MYTHPGVEVSNQRYRTWFCKTRYAAQGGYPKCCVHLLKARADPNCEDEDSGWHGRER